MVTDFSTGGAARTAAEVGRGCELGDEARELLRDGLSPEGYLTLLLDGHFDRDALAFVAGWLPAREAVWWGALCAWRMCRPEPSAPEAAALRAAVAWVQGPGDEPRRNAGAAGEAAGLARPAGGVALAAFWSDGSMAPPGLPAVPPPPGLAARTLAAALNLALVEAAPDVRPGLPRLFVRLALEVARGENRWK